MALRNSKPLTWRPAGVCDTEDASNAFPGAMLSLANLIPSPTTRDAVVPRPASSEITTFGASGIAGAATGSALLVVGNIAYGMIGATSGPFAGLDVPWAYDLDTAAFLPIAGLAAANLPASQPAAGGWTPPRAAVVGTKIVFCHPGFAGGGEPYFGWLDISSFTDSSEVGVVTSGSAAIAVGPDVILDGWTPGQLIAGAGIPASAVIDSIAVSPTDLNTTGTTNGTATVTGIASLAGVVLGALATAADIPTGTYVIGFPSAGEVTLSQAATGSNSGEAINFSGGTTVTISENATATNTGVALTVTGGTPGAPLWGAGNVNGYGLPSPPADVAQFNGRAYFACGVNGLPFSDSGNALQRTNADQALTIDNGLAVTALAPLPLSASLTGGVAQSLIAFQGAANMAQISGDPATDNLALNYLGIGTGTVAPNTICQTPLGLAFIAPDGLRIINFLAIVSDPIGANGDGICNPFINAIWPSRMCAAYNRDVLRVSVQNGAAAGQPFQEWWYHFRLKRWSGPHTFPCRLVAPWQGPKEAVPDDSFLMFPVAQPNQLWAGPVTPVTASNYVENGATLQWTYETALLPDNQAMAMNAVVETALMVKSPLSIIVTAYDEDDDELDSVTLAGNPGGMLAQVQLPWHEPLVFKQMTVGIEGAAAQSVEIGNLYLRYQIQGYLLQGVSAAAVVSKIELEDGGNVGLEDNSGDILTESST